MIDRGTNSVGQLSLSLSEKDAYRRVCLSVKKGQSREAFEFDNHRDKLDKTPTLTRGTDKVSTTYLNSVPVPRARGERKVGLGCARHLPSPVSGKCESRFDHKNLITRKQVANMDVEKDIKFMETSQGCKVMLSYRIENDVIKKMTENIESELFDHMARMRGYRRGNEIENDVEYVCITGCSELDGVHCNAMGSSINDRRAEGCDYCKCGNQETWIEADCFDRLARGLVRKASRVDVAALLDIADYIDRGSVGAALAGIRDEYARRIRNAIEGVTKRSSEVSR